MSNNVLQAFDPHEVRTMQGQVRTVDELRGEAEALRRNLDPDVVDLLLAADVENELAAWKTPKGYAPVGEDQARQTIRTSMDWAHDAATQRRLVQWSKDVAATQAFWQERHDGAMAAPVERDGMRRDLRRLALVADFEGASLAEVRQAYESTRDADDPVFIGLVERRPSDLLRLLKLVPTNNNADLAEFRALQKAIQERRESRSDPASKVALEALGGLTTLPLSIFIDQAKKGRLEIARLPRRAKATA